MIDWNTELATAIAKKQQKKADALAKAEQKKLQEEQAKLAYIEYCKVFDQVIQEEIAGVRTMLDTCSDRFKYKIEITTGNIFFDLEAIEKNKIGFFHTENFNCEYRADIDLATYTRQRLIERVTDWVIHCF